MHVGLDCLDRVDEYAAPRGPGRGGLSKEGLREFLEIMWRRRAIFQWRISNSIQSRPLQGGEGEGIANAPIDAIPHIVKTILNQ